ncbi:MAG: UDP-N-acetylmuramoyl-L-alanyl-D-glutamate--2,6-diaminopimelate ligase [Alphaproteobacteria bacterium]|nr:UDP-N-acetylmuramoyl-L-alanyl-D-glutamate--2,6-diaminopimelate ligase [Alphaproteobacteria bacterium]
MRYLSDLVGNEIDKHNLPPHWQEIDVMGITADSKAVRPGYVFVAIAGTKHDGRDYIADAISHGAVAILTSQLPDDMAPPKVPVLHSSNVRHSIAVMAARFHAPQPTWIAAVTGTDGKTSTAHFYQQIWRLLDVPAASIGTLGVVAPENVPDYPAINTTPDPVLLQSTLKDLALHGVQHVAIEASSHGLDQHRLDGAHIRVAGFTNLTRDHLDYHKTEENYFNAKLRLFTEVMEGGGVAVLNADELHYDALKKASIATGHKVMGYGKNGDVLKLLSLQPHAHGQIVRMKIDGKEVTLDVPLIGAFQVMNILCAMGMAIASEAQHEALYEVIPQLKGVPGRLEHVATHRSGAPVFIDYAHTTGGLESVLTHIRPHVENKLHVVFGCGGNRDRGKRPQMGEIAVRLADVVTVTDDNPRSENPHLIRNDVMAGCPSATEIEGRRKAIEYAMSQLQAGDALIVAGKGHEKVQIIGDVTHPFDDAEVARMAVSS